MWRNDKITMRPFLSITKALADPNRVRVILALGDLELCVCQITALLNLAPSTVSKHMTTLRQAGLVSTRKHGRWMYYRLQDNRAPAPVREAIRWVRETLKDDVRAQQDIKRLKRILKIDEEELCRPQNRN